MLIQNINGVFILDAKDAFRRQATAGKYTFAVALVHKGTLYTFLRARCVFIYKATTRDRWLFEVKGQPAMPVYPKYLVYAAWATLRIHI